MAIPYFRVREFNLLLKSYSAVEMFSSTFIIAEVLFVPCLHDKLDVKSNAFIKTAASKINTMSSSFFYLAGYARYDNDRCGSFNTFLCY